MKTAILTVGTEILFGQVVNTNAAFLSQQLQDIGYDVMYHYTVGDNPQRLKELIALAYRDCDLIITTGGLGPTQDDLTKEIISEYFEEELVCHKDVLCWLKTTFSRAGYNWTENNTKQSYFPKHAEILDNLGGTAPGFLLEKNGKMIAALPGPPREMTLMWEEQLKPRLVAKQDSVIYYRIVRTFALGESTMETKLLPLIDGQTDPTIATYAKEGECSLRITSKRKTLEEAKAAVEEMLSKVKESIGDYIYSTNDEELIDVVGKILLAKGITISCCESCTGGLLAKSLTDIPGISKVFDRGIATYSWNAKMEELGVKRETLEKYTAESPEVAREMAEGLREKTGSELCISITGIAGPDDIDEARPAGLAYIGICYEGKTDVVKTKHRNVSRKYNRNYMLLVMLNEIYKRIKHKRITPEIVNEIYKEYETPEHVRRHCAAVADCGVRIAKALNAHGFHLDLALINGAGLAHDAARTMERHWDVMDERLNEMGYYDEAAIVKMHMNPGEYNPVDTITESDIICLGDRLVKEDTYVGIDKRFDYIIEKARKHGILDFDTIMENKAKMQHLLDEIEDVIGCSIDDLFK